MLPTIQLAAPRIALSILFQLSVSKSFFFQFSSFFADARNRNFLGVLLLRNDDGTIHLHESSSV